jgi:hypothetical protein
VPLADAERDECAEAAGVGGPAPGRLVGHADGGVERRDGGHEARRRPRVEAERVADRQPCLLALLRRRRVRSRRRLRLDAELRRLHAQRRARLRRDLLERRAGTGARGGGHSTLDERCLAQQHALRALAGDHLARHLRAHDGAAQIHQHEHAVR